MELITKPPRAPTLYEQWAFEVNAARKRGEDVFGVRVTREEARAFVAELLPELEAAHKHICDPRDRRKAEKASWNFIRSMLGKVIVVC